MSQPSTSLHIFRKPPLRLRGVDELKKVFLGNDSSVWVGLNVSSLPPRQHSNLRTLDAALRPQYFNPQFPYLCAALVPCALTGDFLACFRSFDVVLIDGVYSLSASQINLWEMFESFTFLLCRSLLPHVNTTVDFALPKFPHAVRYSGKNLSEDVIIRKARNARRAFCILFGMATYLIALTPNWMDIARDTDLPERWLTALKDSPIANFDVREGRLGSFIDFSNSDVDVRQLLGLARKHIPFWVYWGDGITYRPPYTNEVDAQVARLFAPSKEAVEQADHESTWNDQRAITFELGSNDLSVSWDCDFGLSLPMANAAEPLSPAIPSQSDVCKPVVPSCSVEGPIQPYSGFVLIAQGQVESGSRQLSFETPMQFWERQHAEDEEKLRSLRESERKRLLNERDGYHITKKSKVFHWEKFSWGYVRRRVARKEFDDYAEYPLTQMRFSVTRNEWDVCTDFDPDAETQHLNFDSDDSCDFPKVHPPRSTSSNGAVDVTIPTMEEGEILESDHFLMHINGDIPDIIIPAEKHFQEAVKGRYTIRSDINVRNLEGVELDKMLYFRYGLLLSCEVVTSSEEGELETDAENSWATTRGILYDVESSADSFSVQDMLVVTSFVKCLLDRSPIPPSMLDIHPDNTITKEMRFIVDTLRVQKVSLDKIVYFLHPEEMGLILALEDPSLVVEVIRRGADMMHHGQFDFYDIAKFFASRGSPFRTLRPARELDIELSPSSWDLGYRSLEDPPGAFAYAQYEKLLQIFMRQPRARRALGLGGPVWRAILEVHRIGADALAGPSDVADIFGRSYALPDGSKVCEDTLTEAELLFLCGTYKVRKGQNDMLYSWWPSPKQWEAATSNVRYWSPGNERWFMSRLHDIRSGRADWVHMPKWPQKLKTNKKTKRLMDRNSAICEAFLDRLSNASADRPCIDRE